MNLKVALWGEGWGGIDGFTLHRNSLLI